MALRSTVTRLLLILVVLVVLLVVVLLVGQLELEDNLKQIN